MHSVKKLYNWYRNAYTVITILFIVDFVGVIGWCVVGTVALFVYLIKSDNLVMVVPLAFGIALIYGVIKLVMAIHIYRKKQNR